MELSLNGGCACGSIRYECKSEPILAYKCHCRACQRASGSGFVALLWVHSDKLHLTANEPKYYAVDADSGRQLKRGFCAECGSSVLLQPGFPDIIFIVAAMTLVRKSEPILAYKCQCRACQRASGSGFVALLWVHSDKLHLTANEPKYYAVDADSGRQLKRGFCAECGSNVLLQPGFPDIIFIVAASLDDPSQCKPQAEIWTSRAQPWDMLNTSLQQFDRIVSYRVGNGIHGHAGNPVARWYRHQ